MGEKVVLAADRDLGGSLPGDNLGLVRGLVTTVQVKLRNFAAQALLERLGATAQGGLDDFLAVGPLEVTRRRVRFP